MSSHLDRKDDSESPQDDDGGVRVVREDAVTQGTEVENLPHSDNPVDEASEESFPASDPPTYSGRREPDDPSNTD